MMVECEATAKLKNIGQEAVKAQTEIEKFIKHIGYKTSAEEGSNEE